MQPDIDFCGTTTMTKVLVHPEDGRSMVLRNFGILPQHYTASQPEDLDLNLHRFENLKSRICMSLMCNAIMSAAYVILILPPSPFRSPCPYLHLPPLRLHFSL